MSSEAQTMAPVEAADTSVFEREIDRIVYDLSCGALPINALRQYI